MGGSSNIGNDNQDVQRYRIASDDGRSEINTRSLDQEMEISASGAYITVINGINVSTINEIKTTIQKHRDIGEDSELEIQFATIERQAMQLEMGIPQTYQDQMNIIGQHLWEIHNDPNWSEHANNYMPAMEALNRNDTVFSKNVKAQMHHVGMQISTVKATGKKLTRKKLKAQQDWHEWQALEWKQLDAYRDQDMFEAP